jgi:hypothetical protein
MATPISTHPALSPAHQQQLHELVDYVSNPANLAALRAKGGSIAGLLRTYPDEVQQEAKLFLRAMDVASTFGRAMPFQERLTPEAVTAHFGVDPRTAKAVYQHAVDDQLTAALQSRMGTDAERPLDPVTLRDQVAAAFEAHSQRKGN